jgi:hypothetical protein
MLPSTEDAATPFWSPDSHYLAFAAYRKQKRSASPEEMPRPSPTMFIASIADVAIGVPRASYFFCKQDFGPISQIAASGGQVSPATRLNKNETANEEPSFLPDGKHFLYPPRQLSQPSRIKVGVLGKPEQDGIDIAPGGRAAFASDHLLFVRAGTFRHSLSIRAPSRSPAILTPSARPAFSPSPKTAFSPR